MKKDIKCDEVIISKLSTRGDGVSTPIRPILQIFSKEGELIAEKDICARDMFDRDIKRFGEYVRSNKEDKSIEQLYNEWIKNTKLFSF